jgi:threonine aldolase
VLSGLLVTVVGSFTLFGPTGTYAQQVAITMYVQPLAGVLVAGALWASG